MKNEELYILPFDHRNSFTQKIMQIKDREPTSKELQQERKLKIIIYQAFKKAVSEGIPKNSAGILTDEFLGNEVLKKARKEKYIFCLPVEKSGQEEFHYEHGKNYKQHIKKWNPTYVKVLVRYNPEGDKKLNKRQPKKLAELSRYLKKIGKKFMLEVLVLPTRSEKKIKNYDQTLRPKLMVKAIKELHASGAYPDIWKIEGLDKTKDMQKVADQINNGDTEARIIILGRGESAKKAEQWLKAGAKVKTAIGFAIGRTIFEKPLEEYISGKISKEQTIEKIKNNYKHFYNFWKKVKNY